MFGFPSWIALLVVAAVSAAGATYVTREIYLGDIAEIRLAHKTALSKQEAEANAIILASKDAVIAKERELNIFKDGVEKQHAEDQARIGGLRIANGRLVDAAGGLFDKNGRPSDRPSGGDGLPGTAPAAGSTTVSAAGCKLSDTVTADLLDLTRDADLAAIYAQAGHAWAMRPNPAAP